jgi:diguanylate cyclase (GGDEF)-like protein/PAS domain S-box-containing protein
MSDTSSLNDDVQFYSELLRVFFDSANDAIFVLCDEMKFLICNKQTELWLGHTEHDLTEHKKRVPITELLGNPEIVDYFISSFHQALNNKEVIFETRINPPKGKERWVEINMKRVNLEAGDMVIAVARDISQRKKHLATIEYKSNYDALTDLPNRNFLTHNILSDDSYQTLTLVSIDLNRFKEINESLGQQTGDIVLQDIAQRLNRMIDHTSNELLIRLEGDEYVLSLPDTSLDNAKSIALRAKDAIGRPLYINDNRIILDCSIGIACYPEHSTDKLKLMQYAESAMYTAKENREEIGVYDPAINKLATEKLQLVTDLRDAINNKQITPYYQPIININKPDEIRLEALARWTHKSLGPISPEQFIRLAEEIGTINILTSNILRHSVAECSSLLEQGIVKKISINISAYCMGKAELLDDIKNILAEYSIDEEKIVFEITESAMMTNQAMTENIIHELRESGITFAIDDFGTGYSSLSQLKQLPLSELKIDKSFVLEIVENENDAAIAKASIQMAHALGLEVVAEGIENKASWDILQSMGCDYAQGFWMAKPMPFNELVKWLHQREQNS